MCRQNVQAYKLAHVIRYTVLSQNFHFCCFRELAYIRTISRSSHAKIAKLYQDETDNI